MSWLYMVHAGVVRSCYGCNDGTSVTKQGSLPNGHRSQYYGTAFEKRFYLRSAGRRQEVWLTSASSLIWGLVGKSVGTGQVSLKGLGLRHLWWGVVKRLNTSSSGMADRHFRKGSGNQAPVLSWSFGSVEGETFAFGCCLGSKFSPLCRFWLYDLWFCSLVWKTTQFLVRSSIGQFQASSAIPWGLLIQYSWSLNCCNLSWWGLSAAINALSVFYHETIPWHSGGNLSKSVLKQRVNRSKEVESSCFCHFSYQ